MRMRAFPVMVLWGLAFWPLHVWSQEVVTDQVTITLARGQLFGITSGEGIAMRVVAPAEDVLVV